MGITLTFLNIEQNTWHTWHYISSQFPVWEGMVGLLAAGAWVNLHTAWWLARKQSSWAGTGTDLKLLASPLWPCVCYSLHVPKERHQLKSKHPNTWAVEMCFYSSQQGNITQIQDRKKEQQSLINAKEPSADDRLSAVEWRTKGRWCLKGMCWTFGPAIAPFSHHLSGKNFHKISLDSQMLSGCHVVPRVITVLIANTLQIKGD